MIAVVDSLTGQGQRFAAKLGCPYVNIDQFDGQGQEVLLLTRSFNFGEVTQASADFLAQYADRVKGVVVSGNRNWGTNFGAAGDKISAQYDIELVLKYEGSGFAKDIEYVKEWIERNKGD